MKSDWYLKTVLTVIAVALSILVLQNAHLIPAAHADTEITSAPMDVRIVDWEVYGGIKVEVDKWSAREKMNVNIEEVGGWYVNNGVLKVEGK